MIGDVRIAPHRSRDRLQAHLFGNGYGIGLHFAVGVIGADPDQHALIGADENELDFTRRGRAEELKVFAVAEVFRADSVKAGH